MDFQSAIRSGFQNYVTFSGRAARSEFWYFALFLVIANVLISFVDGIIFGASHTGFQPLSGLWGLATICPSISISVRRLHDLDRSGWWWWLWLVPLVGWIILLIWYVTKGTDGQNQYGHDPLGGGGPDEFDDGGDYASSSIPRVDRD